MYFVIAPYEEGGVYFDAVGKEELLRNLAEHRYGKVGFLREADARDISHWGWGNILIIKGEIVVPTAKEVIKVFDVK